MNPKLLFTVLAAGIVAASLFAAEILPTNEARKQLAAGAKLVDVRTVEEYQAKHLTNAVNIPVDSIKTGITNCTLNKRQAILLHCRTGRRSGIAEKELRAIGYTNVFNIGSYEQAEAAVAPAAK
jgi:phage shock protein E